MTWFLGGLNRTAETGKYGPRMTGTVPTVGDGNPKAYERPGTTKSGYCYYYKWRLKNSTPQWENKKNLDKQLREFEKAAGKSGDSAPSKLKRPESGDPCFLRQGELWQAFDDLKTQESVMDEFFSTGSMGGSDAGSLSDEEVETMLQKRRKEHDMALRQYCEKLAKFATPRFPPRLNWDIYQRDDKKKCCWYRHDCAMEADGIPASEDEAKAPTVNIGD